MSRRASWLEAGERVEKIVYLPRAESWEITVDIANWIDESDEGNNTTTFTR